MSENENKKDSPIVLSVKDLVVSFRSPEGKTQAVRGISFDLHKGETLCIVGESGSGKSVSCKAIMGILNPSAMIENGSIMYQGEDLTKISEQDFHNIRGNQIGMIFQDPLSSLNPIMKIGKQITEGMLVNKDRLKIRMEQLVTPEQSAYNSLKSSLNSKKKNSYQGYALDKKELKKFEKTSKINVQNLIRKRKENDRALIEKNPSENEKILDLQNTYIRSLWKQRKEDIELKKKQAKENHKKAVEDYNSFKKETKPLLAQAKTALKVAKKKAKEEVLKYKAEVEQNYAEKKNEILSSYASDQELKKSIRSARSAYQKTMQKLVADRKEALLNLGKERLINPSETQKKIADINAFFDAKEKEAKDKMLEPERTFEEKKEKLRQNKFDNYDAKIKYTKAYAKQRALAVMKEVGIPQPEKRFNQYPFEFSGGMRQRIVIAIALTANPSILICDEPTTALDVTIQAQILELINKLKKDRELSCIFITHDMGVVAEMADRIAVMYAGKIVEYGNSDEIFYDPKHPYTWALLSSIPDIESKEKLEAIPGTPPNMNFPPEGDAFALRSKYAMKIDFKKMPPFFKVTDTHYVASWLMDKRAPKVTKPAIVEKRIEGSLIRAGVPLDYFEKKEEK